VRVKEAVRRAPLRNKGAAGALEAAPMMSIPFFGVFLAFVATLAGSRTLALALWFVSMAAMVVLFKLHATDPLNIAL
jgi:hypothetical protein